MQQSQESHTSFTMNPYQDLLCGVKVRIGKGVVDERVEVVEKRFEDNVRETSINTKVKPDHTH